jgi:hypothetical protein
MSDNSADDIINGPKETTNRHDAEGNLIDASGKKIAWDDSTHWSVFVKSLIHYFFLSLLIGLFGSGFIYMTSRGSDLDDILPTEGVFYSPNPVTFQAKGPSIDVNCVEISTGTTIKTKDNFPYHFIEDDDLQYFLTKNKDANGKPISPGFGKRLKRWFARTVMGCFTINRGLLKSWYDFFQPNTPLGNHAFQMCLVFPFSMSLGHMVPFVTGFGASCIAAFGADPTITIIGLILPWTWFLVFGLTLIIYVRYLATLLIVPLLLNWKEIANIMSCNAKIIAILFGYFACGAAYDNLDSTISGMMAIVFLFYLIRTLYKFLSNETKEI